jgi:two-component system sensor histidine kinase CiaH
MKFPLIKLADKRVHSLRLAVSYLGVIMILSIGFSVFFYSSSVGNTTVNTRGAAPNKSGIDGTITIHGATPQSIAALPNNGIDQALNQQLVIMQTTLRRQLVIFNLGVLAVGAVSSYLLARRTLRPIEVAWDAQEQFSLDASHELRTPLAALRSRSEVALRNSSLQVDEARIALRNSVVQSQRLEQLCDALLLLSRHNQEHIVQKTEMLDEVVQESINQAAEAIQAKYITIEDSVGHSAVLCEKQSLAQIVAILIDNAVKYSPKHSTVYVESRVKGSHVMLSVQDSGNGIEARDVPHIFERFYRAQSARRRPGFGLGLSIAKRLADAQNISIEVASKPKAGSTFILQIPSK